jgi:hypothetical protein
VSLSFDAAGNLFTGRDIPGDPSGAASLKIHRIGPGGSPVVEYGESVIPDPDGVLVDLDGSLSGTPGAVLVCGGISGGEGQILAVLPDESIAAVQPLLAGFSNPNYMALGRDGLLLTDNNAIRIWEFVPPGPPVSWVDSPSAPAHLAVASDGRVFVSHADGTIRVYDADGALVDGALATGFASAPLALGPGGQAFGTDLHALNPGTGELVRFAPDGTQTVVGTQLPTSVGELEFGPDGALYVASFEAGEVLRIAPAALEVDSFFLPTKVAYKPNASDPAKGKLVSAGTLDTGSADADFTGAATLEVGGFSVPIPALAPKGTGLLFREGGVTLSIKPSKTGSSRAKFKLVVLGDLTGAVDPNQPLAVRFANAAVDARGEVGLTGGKFKLGRQRGALVAPAVFLAKLKARLADAGPDSFSLLAGLATDGQTPAEAPSVRVEIGDAYAALVPASAFTRQGDRYVAKGDVGVVLDYLRETVAVKAKGVELGAFAQGANALRVEIAVADDARASTVRAVRKGASLRY